MKLLVDITQKHINNKQSLCPIVLKMKQLGCTNVEVGTKTVHFTYKNCSYSKRMPDRIIKFIRALDSGASVKPTYFELEI